MADIHMPSINDVAPWANALMPGEAPLTADDLAHLPEDDHLYELVEGRLVQMPPPKPRHGKITYMIGFILGQWVLPRRLGTLFAAETGFLIKRQPDTVLAADVAFVVAGRAQGLDDTGYYPFAPDLAVEVASPGQTPKAMATKARQWLANGARLVWIVYPEAQQVEIWRPSHAIQTLSATDTLDGADVLPGFTFQIGEFFA
jgi:Uma2 family endonuclease